MTVPSYERASPEMLSEIVRQAEARLSAQLTAAIAADQRAMTFAGLLLAAAAVLFGAALASSMPAWRVALVVAVAIGLTSAACIAVWSAQPTDWDYVGNVPSQWADDVESGRSIHESLAQSVGWYDDMILGNETVVADAARTMRRAVFIAVTTIGLGCSGAAVVALLG